MVAVALLIVALGLGMVVLSVHRYDPERDGVAGQPRSILRAKIVAFAAYVIAMALAHLSGPVEWPILIMLLYPMLGIFWASYRMSVKQAAYEKARLKNKEEPLG